MSLKMKKITTKYFEPKRRFSCHIFGVPKRYILNLRKDTVVDAFSK